MTRPSRRLAPLLLAAAAPLGALDGQVDPGFSGDGVAYWNDGGSIELSDVVTDHDRVIGVGTFTADDAGPTLHWQMLDARGAMLVDYRCGLPTSQLFPFSTESHGLTALLDRQGRLVVGGWAAFVGTPAVRRALVARFDLSQVGCNLDPTFAGGGWRLFDTPSFCDAESCEILDLVELEPAPPAHPRSLVLLLRSEVNSLVSRHFLVALDDAGELDPDWVGGGFSEMTLPDLGAHHPGASITFVPDRFPGGDIDRIVFTGARYDPLDPLDLDAFYLRCRTSGFLDQQFWILDQVAAKDRLGVASATTRRDVRFFGDQALAGGFTLHAFRGSDDARADAVGRTLRALAVQEEGGGRVLAVSEWPGPAGAEIRRYQPDFSTGTLVEDPTFGGSGPGQTQIELDLGGENEERVAAIALQGGRPLVAGTVTGAWSTFGFIIRFTEDAVFLDGFADGSLLAWSATVP
jgi:hypothetical protein